MTREKALEVLTNLYNTVQVGEDKIVPTLQLEEALALALNDMQALQDTIDIILQLQEY